MSFDELKSLVNDEMQEVDNVIINQCKTSNLEIIKNISMYVIKSGGKRIRPMLCVLSARALNAKDIRPALEVGAACELIHSATLLHDDVIDESKMRRNNPTANELWGNNFSVLVGDFLFTKSFELMVRANNFAVLKKLSQASSAVSEGEILQLSSIGNANVSEEQYIDIISHKTAPLLSASSSCGAILAGGSNEEIEALELFGKNCGLAFQIIDDILDYKANNKHLDKNIGDDLLEKKVTLPLILFLQECSIHHKKLVLDALDQPEVDKALCDEIIHAVNSSAALARSEEKALSYIREAKKCLHILNNSPYKSALENLANLVVQRSS